MIVKINMAVISFIIAKKKKVTHHPVMPLADGQGGPTACLLSFENPKRSTAI